VGCGVARQRRISPRSRRLFAAGGSFSRPISSAWLSQRAPHIEGTTAVVRGSVSCHPDGRHYSTSLDMQTATY
jgi:hypothetical protein